jgi:Zn-dependent protease with chaperone function
MQPTAQAAATPPLLPPKQRADLRPYGNEKTLFTIMAVISIIGWVLLTLGSLGTIWIAMLVFYAIGVAAFSYFISYVRGNGVRVTAEQFPDLHTRFEACCRTIGMSKRPEFYLMTGNGALNAFATRFLHRYYVVLYTEVVDALEGDPDALNFYIGHELGHIAQGHLVHHWWLVFARWIPLLGSAYSRAREYTCDQYGLLCTHQPGSATRALAVLAAGSRRWKTMNTQAYIAQTAQTNGFWMSINELIADYPWLCKRVARVEQGDAAKFPRRNFGAWVLAALVPHTGFGLIGALIVYIYIGIIVVPMAVLSHSASKAATAQIENMATREQFSKALAVGMEAADLIAERYKTSQDIPASLDELGFKNSDAAVVKEVGFNRKEVEVTLQLNPPLQNNRLTLKASSDEDDEEAVRWDCTVSGSVAAEALPAGCTKSDATPELEAPASPLRGAFERLMRIFMQ